MTHSLLFVPGTIANDEAVLIDIGTGYYVEKVIAWAWG
jgi:prefoldin subunit 5